MILYRYCSKREALDYFCGKTLKHENNGPQNAHFYFFPIETMSLEQIKENLHQLIGIVTPEVLMILETNKELEPHTGRYLPRDWYSKGFDDFEYRKEYRTKEYSRKDFPLEEAYLVDVDKFWRNPEEGFLKIKSKESLILS